MTTYRRTGPHIFYGVQGTHGNAGEPTLDVQVLHVERVIFDKFSARFDIFAHEGGEDGVGFGDVFQLDLKQSAALGVHGGFPELRGGHLAQALVTLHLVVLLALFDDVGEELAGGLLFHRLAQDAGRAAVDFVCRL